MTPTYTAQSGGGRNGNVIYNPVVPSTQGASVTFYFYTGLKLHRVTGCKGTFKVNMTAGKFGMIDFTFTGRWNTAWDSPLSPAGGSLQSFTIGAGGAGYVVGDVCTLAGGTLVAGAAAATVRVTGVSSTGVVTSAVVQQVGLYSANPTSNPSGTGGTGSGLALAATYWTQSPAVFLNTTPPVFVNTGSTVGSFSPVFTKLDFDLGCTVTRREDGNSPDGVAGFLVTDRKSKATIDPESVAETTSPIWGDLYAATARVITGNIGTQSGNSFALTLKGVSETVAYGDRSGIRTQPISYSVERAANDTPGSQIALKFF
jgi:hypothetical protein